MPEDLEVHGGYFFQLKQVVNNATITASSDSEFQILEKPKPKESSKPVHKSEAVVQPDVPMGFTLFAGFLLTMGVLNL